jgi:hypothetical protein
LEDVADHVVPHETRQEIVDERPLVVPSDDTARFAELTVFGNFVERIDDAVVILQDAEGELGHDQILVVPRIP